MAWKRPNGALIERLFITRVVYRIYYFCSFESIEEKNHSTLVKLRAKTIGFVFASLASVGRFFFFLSGGINKISADFRKKSFSNVERVPNNNKGESNGSRNYPFFFSGPPYISSLWYHVSESFVYEVSMQFTSNVSLVARSLAQLAYKRNESPRERESERYCILNIIWTHSSKTRLKGNGWCFPRRFPSCSTFAPSLLSAKLNLWEEDFALFLRRLRGRRPERLKWERRADDSKVAFGNLFALFIAVEAVCST